MRQIFGNDATFAVVFVVLIAAFTCGAMSLFLVGIIDTVMGCE